MHVEYYFHIPKDYLIVLGLFNWPIFLGKFTIMYYSKLCFFLDNKIYISKPMRLNNFLQIFIKFFKSCIFLSC